ncbi:hypothetical protein [Sporomusa malonica]|uniref:CobQ/CobB/MinD/ParA nucleotide binding domain-containing protein n=1 Tax=Sporomusa malonica TaxID=112901 RepID=A0A1W2ADA4_9FIRM|nr:hypothetical protein [Sporomusa malonica]SMC58583.1 hypothetical protein SAMN04488500_105212 [Sporomusa malonica]
MEDNRITIFLGEFGSGKTELAVNYALKLQQAGQQTAIVDMDLIKPYFRTRENKELLEKNGVKVVAPDSRLSHADLPVIPHNLVEIFSQTNTQVVMDVGGGESAIALGQLKRYFDQSSYQALLVVNTKRPFTSSTEGIINILRRIEQVSRLTISGLVSNANLGPETTSEHIQEGLVIVEQAAKAMTLPVKWVVVPDWLEQTVQASVPLFILKPYTHYPWMD